MLIAELAQETDSTPRALRYYEECGLLEPRRTSSGYRDYSDDDVARVRTIRRLLGAGFTSAEVAVLLPCMRGERIPEMCPQVSATIGRALATIDDDLDTLEQQRRTVRGLLEGERPATVEA